MILGIISTFLGGLGVYGFFKGNLILIIIGGTAGAIENLIGITSGQQKGLFTAIGFAIAGVYFTVSNGGPIWFGILLGLSFEAAIIGVLGWSMLIITAIVMSKHKRDYLDE